MPRCQLHPSAPFPQWLPLRWQGGILFAEAVSHPPNPAAVLVHSVPLLHALAAHLLFTLEQRDPFTFYPWLIHRCRYLGHWLQGAAEQSSHRLGSPNVKLQSKYLSQKWSSTGYPTPTPTPILQPDPPTLVNQHTRPKVLLQAVKVGGGGRGMKS